VNSSGVSALYFNHAHVPDYFIIVIAACCCAAAAATIISL
jgi:hypothetical protein